MAENEELDVTEEREEDIIESGGGESDDEEESFTNINPQELDPALQQIYKRMQGDYTRKTQQIADQRRDLQSIQDKASAFDELSQRDDFIDYLSKIRGQSQDADEEDDESDTIYQKYGDQAQGMKDLVELVTKNVSKQMRKEFEPISKSFRNNVAKERMAALKEYVTAESERLGLDLPDPSAFAPEIENFIKNYGMSAEQAYYASGAFNKARTRTPVKDGGTKKKGTFSPGTGSPASDKQIVMDTEWVLQQKREGKKLPSFEQIRELAEKGLIKGRK